MCRLKKMTKEVMTMNKKTLFTELKRLLKVNRVVQSIATVVAFGSVLAVPPTAFAKTE
jgi:hypothetical protein